MPKGKLREAKSNAGKNENKLERRQNLEILMKQILSQRVVAMEKNQAEEEAAPTSP